MNFSSTSIDWGSSRPGICTSGCHISERMGNANPAGMTPMIVAGTSLTRTVRPTTLRSPPFGASRLIVIFSHHSSASMQNAGDPESPFAPFHCFSREDSPGCAEAEGLRELFHRFPNVILHGAGSRKENHADFARAATAYGFAALTSDNRGHGETEGDLNAAVIDDLGELAGMLAARPEVEEITADRVYELPEPIPAEP